MNDEAIIHEPGADELLARLARLPEDAAAATKLSTTEIMSLMHQFDLVSTYSSLNTPEHQQFWDIAGEKYKLLDNELNARIEQFQSQIPSDIMQTAREFTTKVTAERDMQKHREIVDAWKSTSSRDPLYSIALKYVEAEQPLNSDNVKYFIEEAKKMVREYFQQLAKAYI